MCSFFFSVVGGKYSGEESWGHIQRSLRVCSGDQLPEADTRQRHRLQVVKPQRPPFQLSSSDHVTLLLLQGQPGPPGPEDGGATQVLPFPVQPKIQEGQRD